MSDTGEFITSSDMNFRLASAMAHREIEEASLLQPIGGQAIGKEVNTPNKDLQVAIITGTTRVLLGCLEQPERFLAVRENLENILDDNTMELLVAEAADGEDDPNCIGDDEKSAVRESIIGGIEFTVEQFWPNGQQRLD